MAALGNEHGIQGYQSQHIHYDERLFAPRFADIARENDDKRYDYLIDPDEKIPEAQLFADAAERVHRRIDKLYEIYADLDAEYAQVLELVFRSDSRDKTIQTLMECRRNMNTFIAELETLFETIDHLIAVPQHQDGETYKLALICTDQFYDTLFSCKAELVKVEYTTKIADTIKSVRQWNDQQNIRSDQKCVVPRQIRDYTTSAKKVIEELDSKMIDCFQYRKALLKKISTIQKSLSTFHPSQQPVGLTDRIDEISQAIKERNATLINAIDDLNRMGVDRWELIDGLQYVFETYYLFVNWYLEIVSTDAQMPSDEQPVVNVTNPLVASFRSLVSERDAGIVTVTRIKLPMFAEDDETPPVPPPRQRRNE